MTDDTNLKEKTLLDWALRLCPDSPRKRIKEWIAAGRFCLDGRVVTKAGMRLADPGNALAMGKPEKSAVAWGHRKRIHPKLYHLQCASKTYQRNLQLIDYQLMLSPRRRGKMLQKMQLR